MILNLNTAGMTEKDLEGGGSRPLPGIYHAQIAGVTEREDEYIQFDFVILAGTTADQQGKEFNERFYLSGKDEKATQTAIRRLTRMAIVGKILSVEDLGKNVPVDFSLLEGRDCVLKVREREYDETDRETGQKTGNKRKTAAIDNYGFAIWSTDDEEVAQVPKDPKWLKSPSSSPSPKTNGQPQAVGAGASTGGSDFDDI